MGMRASTNFYDQALLWLRSNTQAIAVNTTRPATRAEALSSFCLAKTTTVASTDFTTGADSTASGRKIQVKQWASLPVVGTSSGTVDHISLVNATSSKVLYVTTCASKGLTTSDSVTIPAWNIHILGPTSST